MAVSQQKPRVFVSYSWTSPEHMNCVVGWCERLVGDGVDVVFDKWELSEGHDKYAFMERMVTDPSVTHVLIFSDSAYREKANKRERGVGTESQIISAEIYGKVSQDKFIPVVCEYDEDGKPCVPVFLEGRIYIDFSNSEKVNEEWEKLIRKLFNKPLLKKPEPGKPPAYILESEKPANLTRPKYETLRDAVLRGKGHVKLAVADYQESFFENLERFRVQPKEGVVYDEVVVGSIENLLPYRDELLSFAQLLLTSTDTDENRESVFELHERLLHYKFRPETTTSWNESWFDNYRFFLYENFLYLVADLVRLKLYDALRELFERPFIVPETARYGDDTYKPFTIFWTESETLKARKQRLRSQVLDMDAELINKRTTLKDFPMKRIVEAEFIAYLCSVLHLQEFWFPHTLRYVGHTTSFEWFLRGAAKKHFKNICLVLGVKSKDELIQTLTTKFKEHSYLTHWFSPFGFHGISIERLINLDKLDTV